MTKILSKRSLNYYIFRTKINTEIFTRGLRNLLQVNFLSSIFISKSVWRIGVKFFQLLAISILTHLDLMGMWEMIMCWRNSLFGQWQNVNDCKVHVIAGGHFYTNIYTTLFTFYMHDVGRNIKKQTNKNVIFNLLVNILTPICSRHVK